MKKITIMFALVATFLISSVASAEDICVHSHGDYDYYVRTETFKWEDYDANIWSVKIIRVDRNYKNLAPFFSTYTFFRKDGSRYFIIYHNTSRRSGPTLKMVHYKRATRPEEHIAYQTVGHMILRHGDRVG